MAHERKTLFLIFFSTIFMLSFTQIYQFSLNDLQTIDQFVIQKLLNMQILKKLTQNNFNEVAKLIEDNQIPQQLMTGNLKTQLKRYRQSYTTPASISAALKHQQTAKYGYRPPTRTSDYEVCGCCNLRIQKEEISICEKVEPQEKKALSYIGDFKEYKLTSDVALFLTFIKSCIILTLLNSVIHSIFNLVTSQVWGKNCQNQVNCQKTVWNTFSMANKYGQDQWIMIVDILNLLGIVLTILFFTYNRRHQYKVNSLIDCQTQNEADYTIFVSNIPLLEFPKKDDKTKKSDKLQFFYRKHLQQFFNKVIQQWFKQQDKWTSNDDRIGMQLKQLMQKNNGQLRSTDVVKSVSLCYNLSRLEVLQQIKADLIGTFEHQSDEGTSLLVNENGQPLYSDRFSSIPEKISFLNDCEMVLNGQFARDNSFLFSVTHFVGHAFVSFQYEHYKEIIRKIYERNPMALNYNGNYLRIECASHPTDIYWQNIRVSDKERNRKTLASYLILALVLIFSFVILLLLQLLKSSTAQSQQAGVINIVQSYSLTILIAIIILMVNYGLNYLAHILTEAEKRKTRTDYSFSVLIKTFFTKLINTIMLYFFIALLFQAQQKETQFMSSSGLVFQISTLIVITGVLNIFKSFIYPKDLLAKLVRWWKYRKFEDKVENKFQITLNREFQHIEFEFTSRYTYYLVTLYTAFFYSYLVPIGVPVVCILFMLQYWVDKYILFRRSSLKFHFGFFLSNQTTKILESSVFALGLGNLVFSSYMHNYQLTVLSLVGFGIATVFTILVWITPKKLETIIFGEYEYNEKYTYDDCLRDGKFEATYWTQNPATFLIQEEKVTGRKRANNPALNRKSIEGDVFLSSFNS